MEDFLFVPKQSRNFDFVTYRTLSAGTVIYMPLCMLPFSNAICGSPIAKK